ncbi:MAG: hypothetical protein O3B86_02955 [Planctomycetota bacterium]|nr:hypothetical protein [Planctomycetota bacterium]
MRTKFPVLWVLQFFVLLAMSVMSMSFPEYILQYSRGQQLPHYQPKPTEELYDWVLKLETVPAAPKSVQNFFAAAHTAKHKPVWSVIDQWAEKLETGHTGKKTPTAAERDKAYRASWDEVKHWMLSCGPRPVQHRDDIREVEEVDADEVKDHVAAWNRIVAWIEHADEFPTPSNKLRYWISNHNSAGPPPSELREMILNARPTEAMSWSISADYVRESAPCILAAALFTLFGMLSASIRRPLARIFVLVFMFWTVGMMWGSLGVATWSIKYVLVFGGFFVGLTLAGALLKKCPAKASGWTIWSLLTVWWTAVATDSFLEVVNFSLGDPRFWGQIPSVLEALIVSFVDGRASFCLPISVATVAVLGIANAKYWLIGDNEDPPQDDAGIAQGRPPQLWTIWLLQFVILLGVGGLTLINPHQTAHLFTSADFDYLNTPIVDHSVRMLGVWMLALGLFSYFALGSARDWIWQGIAVIFCIVFVSFAVSAFFNLESSENSIWAYLYGFQGLLFVPLTIKQLYRENPWSTENIESDHADWQLTDLTIGLPMMLRPLLIGRRTLYRQGVGAGGVFRMRPLSESDFDDPQMKGVATNEFFSQSKEFPVQLRFSNRTQDDDASLDIRGCALRLSVGQNSPLDMLFATGSFAPIRSLKDAWHILPIWRWERRVTDSKTLREGLVAGLRRAPRSFTCLTYYNQLVLEWRVPRGSHYLVRFRLVPTSDAVLDDAAIGLPDIEELKSLWNQERRPGEPRSSDYLRQRLYDRLTEGEPVSYRFEAQFHAPQREDSLEWYDASLEWDERSHPWHSLGELILDRLLTARESDGLRFDPRNCPSSLRPPQGSSLSDLDDPRSLATAQYRVNSLLGRLRLWRRPSQGQLHTAGDSPASEPPNDM